MMSFRVTLYLCLVLAAISIALGQMFHHRAHDKVPCEDKSTLCQHYPKEKHCVEKSPIYKFMEENCANYCGICNCYNWIYGCCKDRKTRADGPNEDGCSQKLCYDVKPDTCQSYKRNGTCNTDVEVATKLCPWACNECRRKSLAQAKSCHNIGYGCCWDKITAALGHNNKGCPPCRDFYSHVCKQFKIVPKCENTGAYHRRTFLLNYCPETCGMCIGSECYDKISQCKAFLNRGLCKTSVIWRPYLIKNCRKTCGFCKGKSEENLLP